MRAQVCHMRDVPLSGLPLQVHPPGALTIGRAGADMAEVLDMHKAGAIANSDDKRAVENAGLLELALGYTKGFDGFGDPFPWFSRYLGKSATRHEAQYVGVPGLKGIPAYAEEMAISRDIFLATYTDARIHFSLVSTSDAIQLVEGQRESPENYDRHCGYYLWFTDQNLENLIACMK